MRVRRRTVLLVAVVAILGAGVLAADSITRSDARSAHQRSELAALAASKPLATSGPASSAISIGSFGTLDPDPEDVSGIDAQKAYEAALAQNPFDYSSATATYGLFTGGGYVSTSDDQSTGSPEIQDQPAWVVAFDGVCLEPIAGVAPGAFGQKATPVAEGDTSCDGHFYVVVDSNSGAIVVAGSGPAMSN